MQGRSMALLLLLVAVPLAGGGDAGVVWGPPLPTQAAQPIEDRHNWWGDVEGFLNRQAEVALEAVSLGLAKWPPQLPEPLERRTALLMIDAVLHDVAAPRRPAVQSFFHARIEHAAQRIEAASVKEGATIWKLYDHGFVVRTPTVTLGFDIVRGYSANSEGFAVADDLMSRIIRQCDVLFVSHRHNDHADSWVARAFLDQGKAVVTLPEVWSDQPIQSRLTKLSRSADTVHRLPIQGGKRELRVVVYPGHQGEQVANNVTLVFTPEGMSFAHTGDQSNDKDFAWIDGIGRRHAVDVLMPNCWAPDIARTARGFKPQLIIPGHENELGHTVDHREPYWLTYSRLSRSGFPVLVMTWGEEFHYRHGLR